MTLNVIGIPAIGKKQGYTFFRILAWHRISALNCVHYFFIQVCNAFSAFSSMLFTISMKIVYNIFYFLLIINGPYVAFRVVVNVSDRVDGEGCSGYRGHFWDRAVLIALPVMINVAVAVIAIESSFTHAFGFPVQDLETSPFAVMTRIKTVVPEIFNLSYVD